MIGERGKTSWSGCLHRSERIPTNRWCSSSTNWTDADASVYLRRFFDMEFLLPEPGTEEYGRALMVRYGLDNAFDVPYGYPDPPDVSDAERQQTTAYSTLKGHLPEFWSRLFCLRWDRAPATRPFHRHGPVGSFQRPTTKDGIDGGETAESQGLWGVGVTAGNAGDNIS